MDNDAGHKRKELKSNVKRWWHDWFGDYNEPIQKGTTKVAKGTVEIVSVIIQVILGIALACLIVFIVIESLIWIYQALLQ